MTDQKQKPKADPKDSAENLTSESAKPVGPAQPVDVPDAPKNRRMFQNGDTDRESKDK